MRNSAKTLSASLALSAVAGAALSFVFPHASFGDDKPDSTASARRLSAQDAADLLNSSASNPADQYGVSALGLSWLQSARGPSDGLQFVGRDRLWVDRLDRTVARTNANTRFDQPEFIAAMPARDRVTQWAGGLAQPSEIGYGNLQGENARQLVPSQNFGSFGIDVSSKANVNVDSLGGTGAQASALVRFGKGLVSDGRPMADGSWFLFIGADAQALTWKPRSSAFVSDGGMAVEDMVLVGDAQAGVAWRYGLANIALAATYREYSAYGYQANEQFVGMSIAWEY